MKNLKELGNFTQDIILIVAIFFCPIMFTASLFGYQIAIYKPVTPTQNLPIQCVSK